MRIPIRTLSAEDAEVRARTTVTRTVTNGRVECHGLHWYSHALKTWEQKQKEFRRSRRVEVRVDELNLGVVYVDVPDRGYGPIKADSTQPDFTENLSVYELNKLKAELKKKHIASRIGRLSDGDALELRIEHFEALDHKNDPVARRRLAEHSAQMRQQRIELDQKGKARGTEGDPLKDPAKAPKATITKSNSPEPDNTEKPNEMTTTPQRKMKSAQIKRKPI